MEAESQALCDVIRRELFGRPLAIAVDCHSGFGLRDRLWFPYAHTALPIDHLPELHALVQLFDQSLRHHPYVIEPQSRQYRTHGDLWDHLTLQARREHPEQVFLALTLEMGSWLWVKKNPRQFFSRQGMFNPLIAHRQQRVLRRHHLLLDFLARAALGAPHWLPDGPARDAHAAQALDRWYRWYRHAHAILALPTTWVLLRGLTRGAGHWGDFPPAGRPPGRAAGRWCPTGRATRALGRAQPGHGGGADRGAAADLRAQGVALGSEPVGVLALSLGAMVSCDWARRHPRSWRPPCWSTPACGATAPSGSACGPPATPACCGAACCPPRPRTGSGICWPSPRRCTPAAPGRRHAGRLGAAAPEPAGEPGQRAAPAGGGPALPPARHTALGAAAAAVGRGRPPGPPACSAALARAWGCPLRTHPEAGHDLPLDAPDWLIEQVRHWLQAEAPTDQ
jgi:hypothetical protein